MKLGRAPSLQLNWRALNQQTVCHVLDVVPTQLNEWISKGFKPEIDESGNRTYDCGKIMRWRLDRAKADKKAEVPEEERDALTAYRRIKADQAKFEFAITKGEYVALDQVQSAFRDACIYARRNLETMGGKLCIQLSKGGLSPEAIKGLIDTEVMNALTKLNEGLSKNESS